MSPITTTRARTLSVLPTLRQARQCAEVVARSWCSPWLPPAMGTRQGVRNRRNASAIAFGRASGVPALLPTLRRDPALCYQTASARPLAATATRWAFENGTGVDGMDMYSRCPGAAIDLRSANFLGKRPAMADGGAEFRIPGQ